MARQERSVVIDEAAIIDALELDQLRAFAHHQNRLVQKLLKEREQHLVTVEQAFTRRHNGQAKRIAELEQTIKALKGEINQQRKKAS